MRRTRGCLGNTPTFLAVCKKCSRRLLCTGDAGHGPPGSTHSYPDWAAFPAAFFIAYGQPNHERSPLPLLTVLLLLTGDHLEEDDGEKNERAGPLGCGRHSRGLFLPTGSGLFRHQREPSHLTERPSCDGTQVPQCSAGCSVGSKWTRFPTQKSRSYQR